MPKPSFEGRLIVLQREELELREQVAILTEMVSPFSYKRYRDLERKYIQLEHRIKRLEKRG